MRRVLILGAGGTGANVIRRIQYLVEWRKNSHVSNFQNIQFFEIDALDNTLPESPENFLHLDASTNEVDIFKQDALKGHHKWADPDALSSITSGSSATRFKGKFGFLHHYDEIEEAISTRLTNLYSYKTPSDQVFPRTKVYIIANSVNGTGSGCFVDYGYLVRKIIEANDTYKNDSKMDITLILTIPTKSDDHRKLRNAYFALEELNHYMSGNPYNIQHAKSPGRIIKESSDKQPFDYVYLVGPKTTEKKEFEPQDLENLVGEYLYNDIFSPSADKRDGARDNMKSAMQRKDRLGYYQGYMTFGFSTIEYPAVQIAKAATHHFIKSSLALWLKQTMDNPSYELKNILLGKGNYETVGSIYYELVKPSNEPVAGNSQTINIQNLLDDMINEAFSNFREGGYDSSSILDLIERIDDGFEKEINANSGGFFPGIVKFVIQSNASRRTAIPSDVESGWGGLIKKSLLDYMFSHHDGIRLTKSLLSDIISQLGEMENKEPFSNYSSKDVRAVLDDINSLCSDKLLRFCNLHRIPVEKRVRTCKKKLQEYIRLRLEDVTVTSARVLARETRVTLEQFASRLNSFEQSMSSWINSLAKQYDETIHPKPLNGYIVRLDEIGALAEKLVKDTGISMKDFLGGSLKNTFSMGIMCDRDVREKEKADIINAERGNFINKQGVKNVTSEFFHEEEIKAQKSGKDGNANIGLGTVKEQYHKSSLFLSITELDNHLVIVDPKNILHKWAFYPGGEAISNSSEASSNPFAEMLKRTNLIPDWSNHSQDSFDDCTIMFLQEKGCFPLRYLNMLQTPGMQAALLEAEDYDNTTSSTFRGRIDVDFLPLKQIDAGKLNEVKILLLESIAAGTLVPDVNNTDLFVNATRSSSNIFDVIQSVPIKLPRIYKNAVYKLYRDPTAQQKLREQNEENTKNPNGDYTAEFLDRLYGLFENCGSYGLLLSDPISDRREIIARMKDDYIKPKGLQSLWNETFENAIIDDKKLTNLFLYIKKNETNASYPNVGWYCAPCGLYMGDAEINGEPDYSVLDEYKKIHSCNL